MFCEEGRTDGRINIHEEANSSFGNFANAPKNVRTHGMW